MADQERKIEKIENEQFEVKENSREGDKESLKDAIGSLDQLSVSEKDTEKRLEKIQEIQKSTQSSSSKNDKDDEKENEVQLHAEDIAAINDRDKQVDTLVKLATQKDPFTAIKVAKHLDENYVLDQLHDKLMEDEVRNALIDKGVLKGL